MKKIILFTLSIVSLLTVNAATYTVTTAAFGTTGDGISLRWAMKQADTNPGPDRIEFNITGAAPHTIIVTADFEAIDGVNSIGTVVDATTQPLNGGDATKKRIELSGLASRDCFRVRENDFELYGFYIHGFKNGVVFAQRTFTSNAPQDFTIGSAVGDEGNVISGNAASAIFLNYAKIAGGTIAGNYIGVDETGLVAEANGFNGVYIKWASSDMVFTDNVISGNVGSGIYVADHSVSSHRDNFTINNNMIGVGVDGVTKIRNDDYGIYLSGYYLGTGTGRSTNVEIKGNVISGNGNSVAAGNGGLYLNIGVIGLTLEDNMIGVDISGTIAKGNSYHGVEFIKENENVSIQNNVISNNGHTGLFSNQTIQSAVIRNNMVGVDITGAVAMGNNVSGFYYLGNSCTAITLDSNVLSDNGQFGLFWAGGISNTDIDVLYNKIGTDVTGLIAMGNGANGIYLGGATFDDSKIQGNVISGNGQSGVVYNTGQADNDTIRGNFIGVDITGNVAMPNGDYGVEVIAPYFRDAFFGGTGTNEGNIIAANGKSGIYFASAAHSTRDNLITGNLIGIGAGGAVLGNGGHGIEIAVTTGPLSQDFWSNTISCNTIAYNTNEGIEMVDADDNVRNKFEGNSIFGNNSGNQQVKLGILTQEGMGAAGAAPIITAANGTTVSGTSTIIAGTPAFNTIEIFMSDPGNGYAGAQTEYYVDNVASDGAGNWSYTVTAPITQLSGNITVIATGALDNSSEISNSMSTGAAFTLTNVPARCASPVILPIELANFSAACEGDVINVEWSTLAEINNDYFTIEKSNDAINFEEVATVNGAGNAAGTRHYSYYDNNNGALYYRLKQTDFDGKFEYFDVVSANNCNAQADNINVYPNPTTKELTLQLGNALQEWVLINAQGQEVFVNYTTIDDMQVRIDLSPLAQGIYYIRVWDTTNATVFAKKILKQ